ncbi:type II toxin-antitoxin system RatA family toxin [Kitasatospora sp. A2-31]|uniref:type II toxin-antitoxin system RatA family toxin n=1 Tax=Kitasatospora sp. A2-31 TaxID=2916414 RepID=UPI001EE9BAE8|nr:SRPBCC family protein [Kitasatospora sp. A2-31]MCG6498311.1 SRPBCC family protein [Kitasatospora sp. A2-31]
MTRQVTLEALVSDADADTVFARLADFERYPEFTDAVREVRVTEREDGVIDSAWAVNFRNGVLRWSENEVIDPAARTITFAQTTGDFESFDGTWRVEERDGGVVIRFEAEFDLGMASLAAIIDPIAERALVENLQRILTGLNGPSTSYPGRA